MSDPHPQRRARPLRAALLPAVAFGAAAVLLAPAAPLPARAAEEGAGAEAAAPSVAGGRFDFEVWAGGVKVLEVELTLQTAAESYRFDMLAELVGPPAWVKDYRLKAVAEGRFGEAGVEPLFYRQDAQDDGKDKWLQIAYADGLPTVDGDPLPADERRQQVDERTRQGTQDPLTAVLSLVLQVAAKGDCDGTAPIFDGRRRFDVILSDIGPGELGKSRINAYSGPVRLCDVQLEPIAGYRFNGVDRVSFPSEVTLQAAQVLDGLPILPVRLDTTTSYGAIIVHMTGYAPLGD